MATRSGPSGVGLVEGPRACAGLAHGLVRLGALDGGGGGRRKPLLEEGEVVHVAVLGQHRVGHQVHRDRARVVVHGSRRQAKVLAERTELQESIRNDVGTARPAAPDAHRILAEHRVVVMERT